MSFQTNGQCIVRRALLLLAVMVAAGTTGGAAFAEGNTVSATSPPSLNSSQSMPQSDNSLPDNAETASVNRAGANLGVAQGNGLPDNAGAMSVNRAAANLGVTTPSAPAPSR